MFEWHARSEAGRINEQEDLQHELCLKTLHRLHNAHMKILIRRFKTLLQHLDSATEQRNMQRILTKELKMYLITKKSVPKLLLTDYQLKVAELMCVLS